MTAYNDEQAMNDFFNQMGSHTPSYWSFSHPSLSERDKTTFEKSPPAPSLTLDLHGKTSLEAHAQCQDILRFASTHHHRVIKIIHGIGTGTLRQVVTQCIQEHPDIILATNKTHQRISKSTLWVWLKKSFR